MSQEQLAVQVFIDPQRPGVFRIESKLSPIGLLSVLAQVAEHVRCDYAVSHAVQVIAEAQRVKLAAPADLIDEIEVQRRRPK